MNVRLEGTEPEVPSQKLASLNVLCFGRHKNRSTKREGRSFGEQNWNRQTDKQTNGQRARVYEKKSQGGKKLKFVQSCFSLGFF